VSPDPEPAPPAPRLGLWTGIGVNVGTMIGTGVFVSAGYMAAKMSFGAILLAWFVGGVLAMAGARAYASVAELVPRSGGEYRYLSDLVHPWLGYIAGWTSLLAGFSAPVAASAATAGPFAETLFPGLSSTAFGAGVIIATTLVHALDLGVSKWVQDVLALVKMVLIFGFVVVGLALGNRHMPTWQPLEPAEGSAAVELFMANLVFVMYAYSGWNTAVYAAEEFKDPKITVPRSMVIGTALVMALYLLVNWVMGANLTQATVSTFLSSDGSKITLGHLVTAQLLGASGGQIMSVLVVLALISSISSMTMVGPRVYAAMARDGYLPRIFAARGDQPPIFSVLLQGALGLLILVTHKPDQIMGNVGVLLTLTSALTVGALFKVQLGAGPMPKPGFVPLACAAVFIVFSAWMFKAALHVSWESAVWIAVIVVVSTVAYALTRVYRGSHPTTGS
jgi:APA family basic amino acid/polyamine antiporter